MTTCRIKTVTQFLQRSIDYKYADRCVEKKIAMALLNYGVKKCYLTHSWSGGARKLANLNLSTTSMMVEPYCAVPHESRTGIKHDTSVLYACLDYFGVRWSGGARQGAELELGYKSYAQASWSPETASSYESKKPSWYDKIEPSRIVLYFQALQNVAEAGANRDDPWSV